MEKSVAAAGVARRCPGQGWWEVCSMTGLFHRATMLAALVLLGACAAPAPSAPAASPSGQAAPGQPSALHISRALVMAGRAETPSVSSRPLRVLGLTSTTVGRLFNAGLALRDNEGKFRPYLAEALPQLNSDTWK